MSWITDHEADVESDLSAFHRIDDPMTIEAARYFRLALRLAAYSGVLAVVAYNESKKDETPASAPHSAAPTASAPAAVTRVDDRALLATLAAEGWGEHVIEGTA